MFIDILLLADQHQELFCLAETSTCFWTQGAQISSKLHKVLSFSWYVVLVTSFFYQHNTNIYW